MSESVMTCRARRTRFRLLAASTCVLAAALAVVPIHGGGGVAEAQVTTPEITISGGAAVAEGTAATFTVTANPAPAADLSVSLAVSESAGSDYVASGDEGTKTVTITSGATSATYSVSTQADSIDEPNGTVTVQISAGTSYTVGTTSSASVTVNDNDLGSVQVSNFGQSENGSASFFSDAAQAFTTGSNSAGYKLTDVDLNLGLGFGASGVGQQPTFTVGIYEASSANSNLPDTSKRKGDLLTIEGDVPENSGRVRFKASGTGIALPAATTYFVVVDVTSSASPHSSITLTNSDSEDGSSQTGWAIANNRVSRNRNNTGAWSTQTPTSLKVAIFGSANNNAPTVANAIPAQSATVGSAFSYAFPANTFADADSGDTLTYTATKGDDSALPSWLMFDAVTRAFSGTPQPGDAGTVSVKVTASDGGGTVSATFDITVAQAATSAATQVSNTGQTAASGAVKAGVLNAGNFKLAQTFTTGDHANGYTLTEVGLHVQSWEGNSANVTAEIYSTDGDGDPDTSLYSLTKPTSASNGAVNAFTAPDDATLDAQTVYALVVEVATGTITLDRTDSDGEDTGAASGWSIGNHRDGKLGSADWLDHAQALLISVTASENLAPPGPVVNSAAVDGNTLAITFGENLDTNSVPAPAAFTVVSRGERIGVTSGGVAVADATVTLTLGRAVGADETIRLWYTQPSASPLKDSDDAAVESFSRQEVMNNTGSGTPSITSVALVSVPRTTATHGGVTAKDTYGRGQKIAVDVTWDEDVTWQLSDHTNSTLRVRLKIGSANKVANLVTGNEKSGTARTLRFTYTVVSGDTDTDGVEVVRFGTGGNLELVRRIQSATLKNAQGTNDANRTHAGLSAQSGHKVKGSVVSAANSAPAFTKAHDDETDADFRPLNAPSGILVFRNMAVSDADGDPLTFSLVTDPADTYVMGGFTFSNSIVSFRARPVCELANLPSTPASPLGITIRLTATDPDGATATGTRKLRTVFECPNFSAAAVTARTLTVTLGGGDPAKPGVPIPPSFAPAGSWMRADEFTVMAGGVEVGVDSVSVSGSTVTLSLAETVGQGAAVTVGYDPDDFPAAVAFAEQSVTNNTLTPGVQSTAVEWDGSKTTLTLTLDRDLAAVGDPEPWDLRYAFSVDGLYYHGARHVGLGPSRIEAGGTTLKLFYGGMEALPGKAVVVRYDAVWAAKYLRPAWAGDSIPNRPPFWPLRYSDGDNVAGFTETVTLMTDEAVAPFLSTAQVAGTTLTLTFDKALDISSAPAGRRFRVNHVAGSWSGEITVVRGTGTAAITNNAGGTSTVAVTLASKVPQGRFALMAYYKGDDASPLRGDSAGPEVADIWSVRAKVLDRDPPKIVDSSVAGTKLVLYYDEALDTGSTPLRGAFSLLLSGSPPETVQPVERNGVSVHTNGVELTFAAAVTRQGRLSYTKPASNPIQDTASNDALGIPAGAALLIRPAEADSGAPSLDSGSPPSANGKVLTVQFGEYLDPASVPGKEAFTLALSAEAAMVNLAAPEVTGVAVVGKQVRLTISPSWYPCGGPMTLAYAKPSANKLVNLWGSEAVAFSGETVSNALADSCTYFFNAVACKDALGTSGEICLERAGDDASGDGAQMTLQSRRPLNRGTLPDKEAFAATSRTPAAATIEVTDVTIPDGVDDMVVLSLSRDLDSRERVQVSYRRPRGQPGLLDVDGNQIADFSVEVTASGRAPTFSGTAQVLDHALPGLLVSLPLSKADFADPDGDALTYTLSASRDDVYAANAHAHIPDGFTYSDNFGRVMFLAKTACALAALDPPDGDAYYTVVTLTATDPDGLSAHATATFRTDPGVFACPSLSSAAVDGTAVTLVFDADLAPSYAKPTAGEFAVTVDGVAVGLVGAVSAGGDTISLTLASPVAAGEAVAVSYTPGASPVAAAFAGQPATNNTPQSETPATEPEPDESGEPATEPEESEEPATEPDESEEPAQEAEPDESEEPAQEAEPDESEAPATEAEPEESEEPDCATASGDATVPVCAAVSGNELTLTFSRDLAAIDDATARALRWVFLIDGAYHHGVPIRNQSPNRVAVDGATVTLTLGTAVAPGDEVTVSYFGSSLQDTDGATVESFTFTATTGPAS